MTKTTYGRGLMLDETLLARHIAVPEQINGCMCTFPIEFEINGRKHTTPECQAHTNWDILYSRAMTTPVGNTTLSATGAVISTPETTGNTTT